AAPPQAPGGGSQRPLTSTTGPSHSQPASLTATPSAASRVTPARCGRTIIPRRGAPKKAYCLAAGGVWPERGSKVGRGGAEGSGGGQRRMTESFRWRARVHVHEDDGRFSPKGAGRSKAKPPRPRPGVTRAGLGRASRLESSPPLGGGEEPPPRGGLLFRRPGG